MVGFRAGAAGGIAAGVAISLAMLGGRRSGLLHKTLAEDAEDWLDRIAGTRRLVGRSGTTVLENVNHLIAAAAFGLGYRLLRDRVPQLPPVLLGTLYGAGLYAVNIAAVAPLLGITEGESAAPMALRTERLGRHLLYGTLTALVSERLGWD